MTMRTVKLTVNGTGREAPAEPRRTLADFLREDLGLTGTHVGCEHGVCGACTVLLDGRAVRSCLLLAARRTARKSRRSRAWHVMASFTRCKRRCAETTAFSAVSARPALS